MKKDEKVMCWEHDFKREPNLGKSKSQTYQVFLQTTWSKSCFIGKAHSCKGATFGKTGREEVVNPAVD